MIKLSEELVSAAAEGRLVLFLGAGASRGAVDPQGNEIPDGKDLAEAIVSEYLKPAYSGRELKTVYDLACSRRDVRELQRFLKVTFEPFLPTAAHQLLSQIAWRGIATTNYDLLVERAYSESGRLVPVTRDNSLSIDALPIDKLVYLKLHGCITEYEDIACPLTTSTEQIIDHANGRSNMFKTLKEWGQNYTLVVIGYGMSDDNLRTLFYDLIKERDGRPRHFLVRPHFDEIEEGYWRERRFEPIEADLSTFMGALIEALPYGGGGLGHLAREMRKTTLSRFISRAGVRESDHLIGVLEAVFTHVTGECKGSGDAQAFYRGLNQGWYPIESGLDARREVNNKAVKNFILPNDSSAKFYLIRGHAGSGKSVCLKRTAWEAANTYEQLVLFLRPGQQIDVAAIAEIISISSQTVYLFIDDVGEHASQVKHLLDRACVHGWPLVIIGAERLNEWNSIEEESGLVADDEVTLNYLSKSEIVELVLLLEEHGALGALVKLTPDERVERFTQYAGRQLLVALYEATKGASFEEILESEYAGIPSAEAKALYLDICALHRFGPPVRAGLISRIHGISFDEFTKRFFKPLDNVVITSRRGGYGDYVYQARHNYIAEIVFDRAAPTPAHKQEIILRVLDKINVEYSYDEIVLYQLISARSLSEIIPDVTMGASIYEAAEQAVGRTTRLLHQWALYEMRLAGDRVGLERASALLQEAYSKDSSHGGLQHSMAELALRKADKARSDIEAATLRAEAFRIAKRLAARSDTSYAHHTLAKIALADLKGALKEDAERPSSLTTQAVNVAIQQAESMIREGLGQFPNDPFLLSSEATLAELVQNADRALASLNRAFEHSPKSELVASRLATLLMARDEYQAASKVLEKALAARPGNHILNLKYAKNMMLMHPGDDIENPEPLLFHLRRAYRPGRANLEARFLYARQLLLAGRESEGRAEFDKIKRLKLPASLKNDNAAMVLNKDGRPRRMVGQIIYIDDGYAIIQQADPQMRVYVPRLGPLFDILHLDIGSKVTYFLGFNSHGPLASDLQLVQ